MYDTRKGKVGSADPKWKRRAMSPSAAVEERVFGEIRRLCLSGLDEATLLRRVITRLHQAAPMDTYRALKIDPLSGLPTGSYTEEPDQPARARFFLEHIYFEDDVLEFNWMARNRLPLALLSEATGGNLERSLHWREFLGPEGFGHEARGVFTTSQELWGGICAIRERGRSDFSPREVALMRRIAPHLGAGFKAAALRSQASSEDGGDGTPAAAPGVLVLDRGGPGLAPHTSRRSLARRPGRPRPPLAGGRRPPRCRVVGRRSVAPGAKPPNRAGPGRGGPAHLRACEIRPLANLARFHERAAPTGRFG